MKNHSMAIYLCFWWCASLNVAFKRSVLTRFATLNEANTFLAGLGLFQNGRKPTVSTTILPAPHRFPAKSQKRNLQGYAEIEKQIVPNTPLSMTKRKLFRFSAPCWVRYYISGGMGYPSTNRQQTQINHNFLRIASGKQANKRTKWEYLWQIP